jgi:hypothetical protein
VEDVWPPPRASARAALWAAERHLLAGEYAAAGDSLGNAFRYGSPATIAVSRGLRQLAAAGYRYQAGDAARSAKLLEHARERLAPYEPCYDEVDLTVLLQVVTASLES